jgi:hypothetical protein
MLVRICLLTILLGGLSGLASCNSSKITVAGTAINEKECAVVQTDQGFYFLYSVNWWSERYLGKKVRVTGKLKIVNHERQSTDSMAVQERVGVIKIIRKPKWRLAD